MDHTMQQPTHYTRSWRELAFFGLIGGIAGGIALAMLMMLVSAAKGTGFLKPLYQIAATFHQPWAVDQGVQIGPLLLGLMIHMVNSAMFGLILAIVVGALTHQRGFGAATWVLAGMTGGLLLLLVNQYLVLPIVDPAMATDMSGILAWWTVGHLMYGAVLGAIPASPLAPRAVTPMAA
jgi:hypothetical protein